MLPVILGYEIVLRYKYTVLSVVGSETELMLVCMNEGLVNSSTFLLRERYENRGEVCHLAN